MSKDNGFAYVKNGASRRVALHAAAAIVALGATIGGAEATPTKEHFQEQQTLSCSGGTCAAHFTGMAGNQVLDVKHVRCRIAVDGGNAYRATAYYYVSAPLFFVPLVLVSQHAVPNSGGPGLRQYTFDSDLGFRVPSSRQLRVEIKYTGGIGSSACIATGVRLTYP
jgi:hypothetical protein